MTVAVGVHTSVTGSASTATTGAVTTQATGSSFVVFITGSNGAFTPSFTDSFSNSYGSAIANVTDTAGAEQIWAYLCTNGTGGSGHTVNLTNSVGTTFPGLYFAEVTAGALSSLVDGTPGTANITSGGVFTNQVTTTVANDLVFSFVETTATSGNVWTPGSGLTTIEHQSGGPGACSALAWVLASTAGSYPATTPTWTASGSPANGALITLALKNAVASANTATIAWAG